MYIDFIQLCRDYSIPFTQENDAWINIRCPLCDDHGFHGGFNLVGGFYNCFKCGGHHIAMLLTELLGVHHHEIDEVLETYSSGVSLRKKLNNKTNRIKNISLPMDYLNNRCRQYLIKRKFDPDFIHEKYGVVGSTLCGQWAGRMIVPIKYNGKIVSFQGRALMGKDQCKEYEILRYKTLSDEESIISPKKILYNIDNCKNDFIVLVEGVTDVWRFGDDCAATLGMSTTPEQVMCLAKNYRKVFIIFDPEEQAQNRAKVLGEKLSLLSVKEVQIIDTREKHDLGDSSEKEIEILRKELGI